MQKPDACVRWCIAAGVDLESILARAGETEKSMRITRTKSLLMRQAHHAHTHCVCTRNLASPSLTIWCWVACGRKGKSPAGGGDGMRQEGRRAMR